MDNEVYTILIYSIPFQNGEVTTGARDGAAHVLRCLKVWFDLPADVLISAINLFDRWVLFHKYRILATASPAYCTTSLYNLEPMYHTSVCLYINISYITIRFHINQFSRFCKKVEHISLSLLTLIILQKILIFLIESLKIFFIYRK